MNLRPHSLALLALCASGAHAVGLTASGYTQNFDSMGTAGSAAPTDWRVLTGDGGSNATWTTSITANGALSVASMVATTAGLTATAAPTTNNNNGYNAALNATTTSDRVLATAPTTVTGAALELSLTNATGASFSALVLSYETVRFLSVLTANELPGYQLFFSLGSNTWANVAALNPTSTTVPNTVGVSSVSNAVVNLGASVAVGQTVLLRWVDDNATQTSPDQIIGLNNVSVAAVPEAGTLALLGAGLAVVGWAARRSRVSA